MLVGELAATVFGLAMIGVCDGSGVGAFREGYVTDLRPDLSNLGRIGRGKLFLFLCMEAVITLRPKGKSIIVPDGHAVRSGVEDRVAGGAAFGQMDCLSA